MKIVSLGVASVVLLAALLAGVTSSISTTGTTDYDPWCDLDDDGDIDIFDIVDIANRYGTTGTPINKTALLLNLTTRMESDVLQTGLLLDLPAFAYGIEPTNFCANLVIHSLDVDSNKAGDQQTVFAVPGTTLNISGQFQIWARPGEIRQAFFIYSWTPSWPPPNSSYYHALYDGGAPVYPGTTQAFSFNLTIPNDLHHGTYFLYFCNQQHYSIPQAVASYRWPLFAPHAVIVLGRTPY